MHRDQLCAVRKDAFDLQDRHHGGDAGHHVVRRQYGRPERHQLGDASPFPRAFENFVGDDGDRLRMIELQSFGPPPSRQLRRGKYGEAFKSRSA